MLFFFFQAEDGIRDGHVTGVQTCALPILDTFSPSGDDELEFEEDLTGIIELPPDEKQPSRRRRRSKGRKSRGSRSGSRRNRSGRKRNRGRDSEPDNKK